MFRRSLFCAAGIACGVFGFRVLAGPPDVRPAPLEPIPLAEAAEHDMPCCGTSGDPERAGGCCRDFFIPEMGDQNGDGVVDRLDRTIACDFTTICIPPEFCVVVRYVVVSFPNGSRNVAGIGRCMTAADVVQNFAGAAVRVGQ